MTSFHHRCAQFFTGNALINTSSSKMAHRFSESLVSVCTKKEARGRRKSSADSSEKTSRRSPDEVCGQTLTTNEKFALPKGTHPVLDLVSVHRYNVLQWMLAITYIFTILLPFFSLDFGLMSAIFWRLGYNLFLGIILRSQSRNLLLSRRIGDVGKQYPMLIPQLDKKVPVGSELPPDYQAWMMFKYLADLVLVNDCCAFTAFCIASIPSNILSARHPVVIVTSVLLMLVALWAKSNAYQALKDYGWYWGDFFFKTNVKLNFTGVYKFASHPMYTIGYLQYYGFSLLTLSPVVFYLTLFSHMSQFLFLRFVEEPHMKKMYPSSTH